jgi:hypothetical protein
VRGKNEFAGETKKDNHPNNERNYHSIRNIAPVNFGRVPRPKSAPSRTDKTFIANKLKYHKSEVVDDVIGSDDDDDDVFNRLANTSTVVRHVTNDHGKTGITVKNGVEKSATESSFEIQENRRYLDRMYDHLYLTSLERTVAIQSGMKVNSISSALLYCFLLVFYLSAILMSFCNYAVLAGPYGNTFL